MRQNKNYTNKVRIAMMFLLHRNNNNHLPSLNDLFDIVNRTIALLHNFYK